MKRFGVVYCILCGRETAEGDGVCDDCLDGLGQNWGVRLDRSDSVEKELVVEKI